MRFLCKKVFTRGRDWLLSPQLHDATPTTKLTTTMTTITEKNEIAALLPNFSQTILEEGQNGETIENGFLTQGEEESTARVIYALPTDGNYDRESGEFLGDWNEHIVRIEIDQEEAA